MVVEIKNGTESELMEHYRVVTKSQGQSPPPLIALPRPRGHMTDTNITLNAHGQTILSIHTNNNIKERKYPGPAAKPPAPTSIHTNNKIKQRKDPGPAANPPAPTSLTAIRQKKHLTPPRPVHVRTLCDMIKRELNIT